MYEVAGIFNQVMEILKFQVAYNSRMRLQVTALASSSASY